MTGRYNYIIITVYGPGLKKYVTMEEFLEENMEGKVIANVMFPPRSHHYRVWTDKVFKLYTKVIIQFFSQLFLIHKTIDVLKFIIIRTQF